MLTFLPDSWPLLESTSSHVGWATLHALSEMPCHLNRDKFRYTWRLKADISAVIVRERKWSVVRIESRRLRVWEEQRGVIYSYVKPDLILVIYIYILSISSCHLEITYISSLYKCLLMTVIHTLAKYLCRSDSISWNQLSVVIFMTSDIFYFLIWLYRRRLATISHLFHYITAWRIFHCQ